MTGGSYSREKIQINHICAVESSVSDGRLADCEIRFSEKNQH